MRPFRSIRARLIVLIMLAIVPELALLGFIAWNAERGEERAVTEQATRLAALVGSHHEQVLAATFDLVRTLAQAEEVSVAPAARCAAFMQRILRLQAIYSGFARVTPEGQLDCASRPISDAAPDMTGEPFFRDDWRNQEFHVSAVRRGQLTGRTVTQVARRLFRPEGQPAGFVLAGISLDWLSESFGGNALPAGSVIVAFSVSSGQVVTHFPEPSDWIGRPGIEAAAGAALLAAGRAGQSGRYVGLDGEVRIWGFHSAAAAGGELLYAVGLPPATAQAVSGDLRSYGLVAVLVALAGIALAAWTAADRLVFGWTGQILAAARRVTGGHYKARVGGPYPVGELGELAQTFDRMLDEVGRREAELQQREEWFRSVVQHSTDMITIIDADGRYRYVSPAVQRVLGYEPEDLSSVAAVSIVHPDEQQRFAEIVKYLTAQPNRVAALEHRLRHADGHYVEIESIGLNLLENEAVAGIVVNSRDVTRRRKMEEMLRLVTSAVDQSSDGVLIASARFDGDGPRIVYANPALCHLSGHEEHELIGQTPAIFDAPGAADTMVDCMRQSLGLSQPARFELAGLTSRGIAAPLAFVVAPLRDENGTPTHFVSMARDVTDERKAAFERERLEATLRQALKMEAVGTLAGGIAHDFNNVLLPMMMLTQLTIGRLPKESRERQDLERVLAAQKRAKSLVGQILAFSRGSTGEYGDVDLNAICHETMNLLRASLPATVSLAEDLLPTPLVRADSTQIQQVLMNLCTNAAQAMKSAKGTVRVSLDTVDWPGGGDLPAGHYCRLEVEDDGTGIPPDIIERIFDPFFTTKEVGVGTGLGLSVVHGIIAAHKGSISVRSRLGEGTTFTILLPAKAEEAERAA